VAERLAAQRVGQPETPQAEARAARLVVDPAGERLVAQPEVGRRLAVELQAVQQVEQLVVAEPAGERLVELPEAAGLQAVQPAVVLRVVAIVAGLTAAATAAGATNRVPGWFSDKPGQ
jgi:hypothetical protein